MSTLPSEIALAQAVSVSVNEEEITVDLADGRTIIAPLAWFPRLTRATKKETNNCRLIGRGLGIHWPDLNEDVSIVNLLLGQRSGESQRSFQKWLDRRNVGKKRKTGS